MEGQILFEQSSDSSGKSTFLENETPFMDHKESEGIFISPRSILIMRV